jgi:cyclophilin family peptidyl-prolyl cis-trans isomerase
MPDAMVALAAWRRAAADPENDARVAALRVIAAAWIADSASFGALGDTIAALAPPSDAIERTVVRGVGPFRAWSRVDIAARPHAWYAEQVQTIVARSLAGRPLRATIVTPRGAIEVELRGADAPLTVANFASLARRRYYDGLAFHRVVPNFVAQDGDPRGDGSGGPGYAIRDELNRQWYDRGAVGMALSGPDTGGSQYFLAHSPQPHLDGHYTVFGHVIRGLDVLDVLVQGDRILRITVQ